MSKRIEIMIGTSSSQMQWIHSVIPECCPTLLKAENVIHHSKNLLVMIHYMRPWSTNIDKHKLLTVQIILIPWIFALYSLSYAYFNCACSSQLNFPFDWVFPCQYIFSYRSNLKNNSFASSFHSNDELWKSLLFLDSFVRKLSLFEYLESNAVSFRPFIELEKCSERRRCGLHLLKRWTRPLPNSPPMDSKETSTVNIEGIASRQLL